VKVCEFDAIHVENNVAYIDPEKCRLCRKCEDECPKKVIHAINMPARKPKPAEAPAAAPKPAAPAAPKAEAPAAPKAEA
jgi:Fe-S-cluster-containing hydrogenase component 2